MPKTGKSRRFWDQVGKAFQLIFLISYCCLFFCLLPKICKILIGIFRVSGCTFYTNLIAIFAALRENLPSFHKHRKNSCSFSNNLYFKHVQFRRTISRFTISSQLIFRANFLIFIEPKLRIEHFYRHPLCTTPLLVRTYSSHWLCIQLCAPIFTKDSKLYQK